ncbi:hypothetical protein L1049_005537 [Liquidambar formosana]|uniref:Ribosomal protein S11 n=1 Tax=Liquidambar formosana TaxID=63359 RepID=A0AAP0RDW5_LIQFO
MYSLARSLSVTKARAGLLLFDHAFNPTSHLSVKLFSEISRPYTVFPGCFENLKGRSHLFENVASGRSAGHMWRYLGNWGKNLGFMNVKGSVAPPYAASFQSFVHSSSRKDVETLRNSKPMNFVRGILEENGKDIMGGSQLSQYGVEQNADFVHIKLIRNNTFVTVTDSKGNKKIGASSGCLPEMKGGPKLSRYAAEATAEHVGRMARNLGLKSVVMKVKGFTYFKKKRQAIMSWREGYTYSRGDLNPIVYIEDTTRRAHNGCRLPKRRRV